MSSGEKDAGAGPSQPMSIEYKARKANIMFWWLDHDLSGSNEEAEEAAADEVESESEYDFEAEDGNDAGSSNGDEEDGTSHGGDCMDVVDRTPPLRRRRKGRIGHRRHSAPSSKISRM
jgi:hypothetical protein